MTRYVIADPNEAKGWPHPFPRVSGDGGKESKQVLCCRFVYDTQVDRLVHLDILRLGWVAASPAEVAEVEGRLKANAWPEQWGLIVRDDLPRWCNPPQGGADGTIGTHGTDGASSVPLPPC